MSRNAANDEIFSGGFAGTSNSLLRIVGGWGNISGPSMFMIRAFASGTITSVFTGVTGSLVGALIYGTAALPFVVGSCAGFLVGIVGFYRDSVRKSMIYLDRYPRLLQHHLDAQFPHQGFLRWSRERLSSRNFDTWVLRSMLIVGWLSAMPAIDTIFENQERGIVEDEAVGDQKDD